MFDQLFYSVYELLKPRFKRKATDLAILYLSVLQVLMVLVLGVFFSAFFRNMNSDFLSGNKAWIIFIIITLFLFFKNWIQYSGKQRVVKNSKVNRTQAKKFSVWGIILFPVGCIVLLLILTQAV